MEETSAEGVGPEWAFGYGTLLGMARHSGTPIPWDDDVDVLVCEQERKGEATEDQ